MITFWCYWLKLVRASNANDKLGDKGPTPFKIRKFKILENRLNDINDEPIVFYLHHYPYLFYQLKLINKMCFKRVLNNF